MDECLIFEMYLFEKEKRKPPSNEDMYERLGRYLSKTAIDEAIKRLLSLGLIFESTVLNSL